MNIVASEHQVNLALADLRAKIQLKDNEIELLRQQKAALEAQVASLNPAAAEAWRDTVVADVNDMKTKVQEI